MGPQPQSSALVEEQEKRLVKPERLFHEINLLHLEGHYFAFDPKAANVFPDPMKSVEKRLLNPKINEEQPIEVIPHPGYGKPSVFAYKVYQAILKKLSDYGHPVPEGGLAEASKTNFDIKTLGGLKKYYLPFTKHLAAQARATAKEAEESERRAAERKLAAYDSYRQGEDPGRPLPY